MLVVIVAAIVLLACGSLLYNLKLLDELDEQDSLRKAYANERQNRFDCERTVADQTRHLVDLSQANARFRAERDDALGKLGALGQLHAAERRRELN